MTCDSSPRRPHSSLAPVPIEPSLYRRLSTSDRSSALDQKASAPDSGLPRGFLLELNRPWPHEAGGWQRRYTCRREELFWVDPPLSRLWHWAVGRFEELSSGFGCNPKTSPITLPKR